MSFKPLDEVLKTDLVLPVNGGTVTIPPVDAATGLALQKLQRIAERAKTGDVSNEELAQLQLDDDDERDLMQRVLGPVYDKLVADPDVNWEQIKHIGNTATVRAMANLEAAENFWNAGGKAPRPGRKPADRKGKKGK